MRIPRETRVRRAGSARRCRGQRPRGGLRGKRDRCAWACPGVALPSEQEVRPRHAVDAGQQDGEFNVAVGIDAAEQPVTGGIEAQLPGRVGAVEGRRADEIEGVVVASWLRIDGPEIDLVLALLEVGDPVAGRAVRAAVGNGVEVEPIRSRAAGEHISSFQATENVFARTADQLVVARTAFQRIVARPAVQRVVTPEAVELVGKFIAGEYVGKVVSRSIPRVYLAGNEG